jgi:hypothetical protein
LRPRRLSVERAATYLDVPIDRVEACLRYYADYGDEVDEWIDRARDRRARGGALATAWQGIGVKLLLDEHYSPAIARQLRTRGHDVMAVAERPDLVGLGDDELLARMAQEQRAIMTDDVKDFLPLAGRATVAAEHH